jgi:hypothetical protein
MEAQVIQRDPVAGIKPITPDNRINGPRNLFVDRFPNI